MPQPPAASLREQPRRQTAPPPRRKVPGARKPAVRPAPSSVGSADMRALCGAAQGVGVSRSVVTACRQNYR